jgi:glycosyltransferase involved in cell wall biosynthesis
LLTDRKRHADVAAAGIERVRQYTWERCARATLSVLERVGREGRAFAQV